MNIPELDQKLFPRLPEVKGDEIVVIYDTVLNSVHKEIASAIVLTACTHYGRWAAISEVKFVDLLLRHPLLLGQKKGYVLQAMWELIEDHLLELVELDGIRYLAPTPKLAQVALARSAVLEVMSLLE